MSDSMVWRCSKCGQWVLTGKYHNCSEEREETDWTQSTVETALLHRTRYELGMRKAQLTRSTVGLDADVKLDALKRDRFRSLRP